MEQDSAGNTYQLTSSLLVQEQASVLFFAPLWLFPPSVKLSHVNLKRMKNQKETVIDLDVLKNNQSDLSRLSLDPVILRQCFTIWQHLYRKDYFPQITTQSDHRHVLVHGGVYSKGTVMKVALDFIRSLKGKAVEVNEVFKYCYVFWCCEKEQKYGYVPLSQLLYQWNSSFLLPYSIQSDSTLPRFCDVLLRDEAQTVLKYSMQGTTRVYHSSPGQKVWVLYSVSDVFNEVNSIHQM